MERFYKSTAAVCAVAAALFCGAAVFGGAAVAGAPQKEIAWAEPSATGFDVFYTRSVAGGWRQPLQLSRGGTNLLPALTSDGQGRTWLAWTVQQKNGCSTLSTTVLRDGAMQSTMDVATGMTSNTSPSMVTDGAGTVWLFWAGFDGVDDDIFASRWTGSAWEAPQRVSADDATPDTLPVAGTGPDGMVWVEWRGYAQGRYQTYRNRWTGRQWEGESLVVGAPFFSSSQRPASAAFPAFVRSPGQASVHVAGAAVASVPCREMER